MLGFVQLRGELFQLFAQLALKLEHGSNWLSLFLCVCGVESIAPAQHCLLDLSGDDWANLAQVFTYGFNFDRGTHQKFKVTFQFADFARNAGSVEAATNEMMNMHLVGFLTMAIHATVPLFHPVWIPWNLEVNELGAVIL